MDTVMTVFAWVGIAFLGLLAVGAIGAGIEAVCNTVKKATATAATVEENEARLITLEGRIELLEAEVAIKLKPRTTRRTKKNETAK